MRLATVVISLLVLTAWASSAGLADARSAHDFSFTSIEGEPLPLEAYEGRPVLVVNTASLCGFTYQYAGLQDLWERYRDHGFVLLAVPSNDFGNQEPGSEAEIKEFCEVNFDIDFLLTEKQTVKGEDAHPFFRHVRAELGEGAVPKWNFHKYLVGPDGELLGAWPSRVEPTSDEITSMIEKVLAP
ncbi:MAG: glutathione peroxidase [Geminicoccaceae bacterium]|nr:glutathione peroxidase [Geminicoccaceae bacterium]